MTARTQPPSPPVRVEVENERVWCGEHRLKLTPKAFAVLRYLVEHAGRLVTKDQLLGAVWLDTVVSEWALASCIGEIRKALKDTPQTPQYIETVHRRGFRFIAPITTAPPVSSSRFQASSSLSHPVPSTQHLTPTLVGREPELVQLHKWLEKALHGERQIVFVTGEPGIGKTTVGEALLEQVATDESMWIGRGQCIEHFGAGEAYLPVLEALGRLCREPGHEHFIEVLHQHAPTWLVQMPALLSAADLEALQRKVLGATQERMLREMAEALEALTAERGLVLWLEDLHWSDYSTLDLLSYLARRPAPARLLVLGTYRPVDVIVREHPLKTIKQELQLHGQCEELPLELLPEGVVREYLTVRFAGSPLPAKLARMLYQRTEGNPLFMVTVVEELIARAVLVQREGRWELAREVEEGEMPASLRHFIEQQLERVSPEEQQVLEAASVAGMEFSAAAVAAGLEEPVKIVEQRCEGLARREQFLRVRGVEEWPDGTAAARYGFLHALYHEMIYDRVTTGQRIGLHRRIGEREEAAYGTRAGEIAAALAVHFEQGRDYQRAVQYLQQAGENAIRLSAHQEAIHHLTKGLELLKTLPDTPRRAQQELMLQIALGGPLIATKGFGAPQVGEVYTLALELCQQVGETPRLFRALRGLSSFYNGRGDPQTGRKIGEQMLRLAQKLQDPALLLCTHHALGATLLFLGDLTLAREHFEQGATLYDRQQPCSSVSLQEGANAVCCLAYLSSALCFLGYPDRALERSREALNLAQKLSHPFSQFVALTYAANLHHSRREAHAVQEWAEANIVLSRERGFPVYLAAGMVLHGWALVEQGQGEEGIAQMLQGLTAMRTTGTEISRPFHLSLLAEAYEKMGQVEEGLAVVVEALAMVERTEIRYLEARLYRLKGELLLVQEGKSQKANGKWQKLTEAEECFLKAIEVARRQQAKIWELRATVSLARLWQQQGKQHAARTTLSEIYGWFTEGFDTKDLQEAKALLEELA
jgi:DNA-binding winged helix-turn-helix (wHTH) protein/predicted ATPase